jgi:hypothetical protein
MTHVLYIVQYLINSQSIPEEATQAATTYVHNDLQFSVASRRFVSFMGCLIRIPVVSVVALEIGLCSVLHWRCKSCIRMISVSARVDLTMHCFGVIRRTEDQMISAKCSWRRRPAIDDGSKSDTVARTSGCRGLRDRCNLFRD